MIVDQRCVIREFKLPGVTHCQINCEYTRHCPLYVNDQTTPISDIMFSNAMIIICYFESEPLNT